MTTATAPASTTAPSRLRARVRVGQALLTALLVISGVFGASGVFVDHAADATPEIEAASFALLAVVLGLVAVWGGIRSRLVQLGLVAVPLFFVWHVAAFGTWIPDGVFALISGVAVALVLGAGRAAATE